MQGREKFHLKDVRREDLQMKIPAVLHLSRLGYGYLSRKQIRGRDRKTNILPDPLKAAIERINGIRFAAAQAEQLMTDFQTMLNEEDLGRQFYETIRDGWNGLRLIDFVYPQNNVFQSATEVLCGSGAGSFRPDITLFVNGLPLAMIEVKIHSLLRGLQSEYDRMVERVQEPKSRRYLQCTQVWAFSDDHAEDLNRLLPMKWTSFATAMEGNFPLYALRGKHSASSRSLLPRNPEEEQRILVDHGIQIRPQSRTFQKSLSPNKPVHKMLTALFEPRRFLFLLRYGFQYMWETDLAGKEFLSRRMLSARQLSALRVLIRKAEKGYRNWTIPPCGAAGEQAMCASLVALLQDLLPGAEIYWVSRDKTELFRDRAMLESCGVSCAAGNEATEKQLKIVTAEGYSKNKRPETGEGESDRRRIFLLPTPVPRFGTRPFHAWLRKAEPNAILVTRISDTPRESNQVPLHFTNSI